MRQYVVGVGAEKGMATFGSAAAFCTPVAIPSR